MRMDDTKISFKPLISIIVPVFNSAPFLERCLTSLLEQSYKNTEIILVDDGSTDNSPTICDLFAEKESRIVVIHQKNLGVSVARNTGITCARGNLLAFIDADDYISTQMIEKLFNRITSDQADVAICGYKKVDEKGNELRVITISDAVVSGKQAIKMHYQNTAGIMVLPVNKLYHKKLFEHIRFPEGKRCEDEALFYRILDLCERVSILSEPYYCYVQHENSFMGGVYKVARLDGIEASFERYLFYSAHSEKYQDLLQPEGKAFVWLFNDVMQHFQPTTKEEKERVHEIYKMARIMCSQREVIWSLRQRMKLRFPVFYYAAKKIKDRLFQ